MTTSRKHRKLAEGERDQIQVLTLAPGNNAHEPFVGTAIDDEVRVGAERLQEDE